MPVIGSFLSRTPADAQIAIESNCQPNPGNASLYRGGQRIVSSTQIPGPGSDGPQEMEEHPWKDA